MEQELLLTTYSSYPEARLAQDVLLREGVRSIIRPNGVGANVGPQNLFVPQNNYDKAKAILEVKN